MFSAVGKNVFKYAEVGYQRLGSAMATRVSDGELAKFVALAADLCDKFQVSLLPFEAICIHEVKFIVLKSS